MKKKITKQFYFETRTVDSSIYFYYERIKQGYNDEVENKKNNILNGLRKKTF